MDDFKRAQFDGKGNYCPCHDIHPDRCSNSAAYRGRVRGKLKRMTRQELSDTEWERQFYGDDEWTG